jgi:hypothetical protein
MLKIVKCETADISHRNKALSGCLDILKSFLTGLTALPLNLNSELCTIGATFIEDFSDLETPPYIQITTSIHTHSHAPSHTHSHTQNRHNRKHQDNEKSDSSNSNLLDSKIVKKDDDNIKVRNKMNSMINDINDVSKNKDRDKNENRNENGNENGTEEDKNKDQKDKYENEYSDNGGDTDNNYNDDNNNNNNDSYDNKEDDNDDDDNIAINDWLHYCDQNGIDLSLAHAQTTYLSSSNDQNNNNHNINNNNSNNYNSNFSSSNSNSNNNNNRGGEGGRSRTGSMRTSLPPITERDRDSLRGRDRGRDRESIDDKISQTRSRSHLLLALPSIVAIICLSIPHTPHTGTHTSTDANADMNASATTSTHPHGSTGVGTGASTRTSSEENGGVQRLRSAACHAVSRVNMSALVESYNDLEERAKTLKAENTQLQLEINNLQSNAANLPF